jgi:MFS family permease
MSAAGSSAGDEWKAHWPLVLAAMVGFSFYAMVTYSLGTFMEPLQKAFGWSRATISLGLTIFGLCATVAGPPIGALIDRWGTRRIALCGLIASGATFACFSLANGSVRQWITLWVAFSLCSVLIKSTIWSAATSSVFTAGRGLALAAVLSGSALGQTLAPLVANALIAAKGWREAYLWIGVGWAGLGAVAVFFLFFDAHALGRRKAAAPGVAMRLPGLTIAQACRDSRVIRIAVANLLMSFTGSGVTVHLVPLIAEAGVTTGKAVQIAATAGIAGIVGKFLSGYLLDRIRGSLVPVGSFAVGALGYFLLLDLGGTRGELLAGTLCLGFVSGAGLQVSTYLISRYAGLRNFGVIFGTIASAMMLGSAFGPAIAGRIHDVTGSYAGLLWAAIPVMSLCALLFAALGPYRDFTAAPEEDGEDDPAAQAGLPRR